jgi:hypothetical protein
MIQERQLLFISRNANDVFMQWDVCLRVIALSSTSLLCTPARQISDENVLSNDYSVLFIGKFLEYKTPFLVRFVLLNLLSPSTIFKLYHGAQFNCSRKPEFLAKPSTLPHVTENDHRPRH